MALLNSKNRYIKLACGGSYEIYASEEARIRAKQSVSSEVVLAKYRELLRALDQQDELKYYDPDGFAAQFDPLQEEYYRYWYNLINYKIGQEYPLMAKIFPDVADSIPEVVEAGVTLLSGNNAEEVYLSAKQSKRFGETIDV